MYVTPDYVLGALSFLEGEAYNALVGQNRAVGVVFASNPESRLAVYGAGTSQGGRSGLREINAIAAPGAMVVARDPLASRSLGTRVFLPGGELWERREEVAGWLFSREGDAWLALRVAGGGYRAEAVAGGRVLELSPPDSPVVLQMGRAADYSSYGDFRASVLENALRVLPGSPPGVRYRSEAGDLLEIEGASAAHPGLARLNGEPLDLDPPATYASPYLFGLHGSSVVELSHPLFPTLRLDFSDAGAAAPGSRGGAQVRIR
jgi:hypothetical protein